MSVNTDILNGIIYGRVEPHIYAFTTQTVPNYLKVGDTYRPVQVRLAEWKKKYENLQQEFEHTAKVSDDAYFRDYAIHEYLENNDFHRIRKEEFTEGVYPSNEFFRDATGRDVKEAIDDIQNSYDSKDNRYAFYNAEDHLPLGEMDYERNADWKPRKNQQDVIDRFKEAVKAGRTNLLMYAVMRFGKSFTALCCAKEIGARLVVVVCGKTAVRDEWKINVQRPEILDGYHFVTTDTLRADPNAVTGMLAEQKRVVVFLTLQDLLGDDVKDRHKDLFVHNQQGDIDLLIIDESHFAARSQETGKVLNGLKKETTKSELDAYDQDYIDLEEPVKLFAPKVKLHLSGTPYRILMDGEFQEEDVIAFVQYNDIIDEQQKWDNDNLDKDEWENPYYGFPQMVRFAFNLNQSSINRLNELRNEGVEYRLNTLLCTNSLSKTGDKHFVYGNEVLDLLKAIDGSKEDENIFSFLDYGRIQEGKMCRHIVMVLPFRASCDAMKELLSNNDFAHLGEYEVLNLAGFGCPQKYSGTDYAHKIKEDIRAFESRGKKTITLTVGKMLTGSTVREWDTMIFLKDASSPQEYDQAIFRLQSQYVKTIKSEDGEEIRCNMKPQTLLVDFDPTRMFVMQNRKSLVSNVNTSMRGNEELTARLQRDLEISPIIWLNKGKLQEVVPTNIIDAVRRYSANKSVMDETLDVIVDDGVFDDARLKTLIGKEKEFSTSGNVFKTKPNEGEGDNVNVDEVNPPATDETPDNQAQQPKEKIEDSELKSLRKKLQTYYFKLLLFAYLSDAEEKTLKDINERMENSEDGKRIAGHLQLDVNLVKLIREKIHPMALNELENKISNIDDLGEDVDAEVQGAFRRFSRLSSSEITTPEWLADEMVGVLPDDVTSNSKFLNIAGKIGEFEYSICKKYGDEVKKNIFTIPTSGLTYECTRKMFRFLGIPVENIFSDFTSYDLIDETKKEDIMKRLKNIGFDVALGNPPYQDNQASDDNRINRAFASAIYPSIINVSRGLNTKYISMITPSRWMTKTGQGVSPEWVDEMIATNHFMIINDFYDALNCFKNVEIKGGVSYFLYNKEYDGKCMYSLHQNGINSSNYDYLNALSAGIVIRDTMAPRIIKKLMAIEGENYINNSFSKYVGPQHFFDKNGLLTTSWRGFKLQRDEEYSIKYYLNRQVLSDGEAWIKLADIPKNADALNQHKIFLSKAYNGGDSFPHQIIGKAFYGEPNSVCSQTYLIIGYDANFTKTICEHIISYMKTRFFRYMVFIKKKTQDNPSSVFQFVPLQDFTINSDIDWSKPIPEVDKQLYSKYGLTEDEIDFIETMIKPME